MLQKGSSEKWPQQLMELTGTDKMDVSPLIEYFEPLIAFLDEELDKAGEKPGWTFDGIFY